MSVTISGIKNLDANDYERMVIKKQGENYRVIIKGKTKYKQITTTSKISDELKEMVDDDKLKRLVKYFLDYSKLNYISDGEIYSYYDGRFSTANGTRQLDLQISKKCKHNIPKMVLDKYLSDRLGMVNDLKAMSYYEFCYNTNHTSYGVIDNGIDYSMRFNLIGKNDKLYTFEEDFLKSFINNILENTNEKATLGRKKENDSNGRIYSQDGVYFTCGDVTVKLFKNAAIVTEVQKMVYSHNREIAIANEKQLKLGGF